MITLCFLVPASLSAQRLPALHTQRYHPLSIDSSKVVSAPASQQRYQKRALAAGASPVASEFVSASGTYFQVSMQKLITQSHIAVRHLACAPGTKAQES